MVLNNRSPHKPAVKLNFGRTLILAVVLILATLLVLVFIVCPHIVKERIKAEAKLAPGSETWVKWKDPTYPILIKFYIFNTTIPKMVQNQPLFHVKETGPYVWEEKRSREVLETSEEEDTVTFKESTRFYYRPDLSNGSEDDLVDIVNIPLLSFSYIIYKKTYSFIANSILAHLMSGQKEGLIQQGVKVRDLIFDGVKINPLYETLSPLNDVSLPPEFRNGTFALYNDKNGSYSPEIKVNRGIKDISKFGKIVGYDKQPKLPYWKDEYCNAINGSDGSLFPPFVTKDRVIYSFIADICRSVYFEFVDEVDFRGVPAYLFRIPQRMLDHPMDTADNECFDTKYEHDINQYEDYRGAYRLFTCKGDIPLVVSKPHLHTASKRMREGVVGLKPNGSLHETDLIIEPQSGAVLYAAKRIMVNIEHIALENIHGFENVYHALVPIAWVEESMQMDEENLAIFKRRLIIPTRILNYAQWTIVVATVISAICGLFLVVRNPKKLAQPESLLDETEKTNETFRADCESRRPRK